MKITKWIMICLLAVALAPMGCGKKQEPIVAAPTITIDVPKLRAAFESAGPELKAMSEDAIRNVQYGRNYNAGLATLEQLANTSGVTEDQKKIALEVADQVKRILAARPAPPAQ